MPIPDGYLRRQTEPGPPQGRGKANIKNGPGASIRSIQPPLGGDRSSMPLPVGFQEKGSLIYHPAAGLAKKKVRLRFLERTLQSMARILEEFLFSEAHAGKRGLLQALDPRLKLLTLVSFVVTVSFLNSVPMILGLYGVSLGLALLSRVPAAFFIKRVWLVLPLFAGVMALPASTNLFTPGDTVATLFSLGRSYHFGPYSIPAEITLTRQGIASAMLLVSRVGTSMSFLLLLTLTTPWADLFKALRCLRIPVVYVQTLGMTLRYLLLLCQMVQDMHIAKKSRTIRVQKVKREQQWIAGQVATLYKRSMQLSQEVHRAMVARGYQGEVRILTAFRLRPRDGIWTLFCAGLMGFFIWVGR